MDKTMDNSNSYKEDSCDSLLAMCNCVDSMSVDQSNGLHCRVQRQRSNSDSTLSSVSLQSVHSLPWKCLSSKITMSARVVQSCSHLDTDFVMLKDKQPFIKNFKLIKAKNELTSESPEEKVYLEQYKKSPNTKTNQLCEIINDSAYTVEPSPANIYTLNTIVKFEDSSRKIKHLPLESRELLQQQYFYNSSDFKDLSNNTEPQHYLTRNQNHHQESFSAAQKFFTESGILGPICNSNELIRKTSRALQDSKIIDQIRKTSHVFRTSTSNRRVSTNTQPNSNCKYQSEFEISILQNEILSLKAMVKTKDNEIFKLQRELHKLKSVLQMTSSCGSKSFKRYWRNEILNNTPNLYNDLTFESNYYGNADELKNYLSRDIGHKNDKASTQNGARVFKKQGVSAESCEKSIQKSFEQPIPKYSKDFSSKQLIKDALMENDFLKNIDSSQVKELVDSMYPLKIGKGEFVIREGDVGAHLYVSASGEFEVIQNGKILDQFCSNKAFGELAILYNCTRTASIRVLSAAELWVLDRRVFQQIMMRTGLQRIENSVNFLKSVPLLKNLSEDILVKIADVMEVEFYTAETYIIRQGASGDTFFLISQGMVKVTQKQTPTDKEKELRTLSRGDYFGEQALINEDKRTANIIAMAPGVECLTLDRDSFMHLIGDLCELKQKCYSDEKNISEISCSSTKNLLSTVIKLEFPEMKLSDLEIVATLGIGGFGRVELVKVYNRNCVEIFALKCLAKQHIKNTRQEEHVYNERTIMLSCNSSFICRLYRTFRDEKYVYMLLEACMGGEIWTMLRDYGAFNENAAQFIGGCVLQAFDYLHSRGIIYRDLKPENLMMDQRGYVKLVDFGFAKYIGRNSSKTWTFCGTPEYVAPEIILNKGHDRAVDYWAFGILIHELLNGAPPFTSTDPLKTYSCILKGIDMIIFPKSISKSAVQLIKKLCRHSPSERLGYQKGGMQDIKKHKWFLGFDWDGLETLQLKSPFERSLSHSMDTKYFDDFPCITTEPLNESSGWDNDF